MVDIRIVIEGGVLPNENISAATIDNSEKLREAFHKLLSRVVNPETFNLVIEVGAGYKNAARSFRKYALLSDNSSLLIDLDGAKPTKEKRLNELGINEFSNQVFFMVQEMEAWILSQPEVIEKCYKDRFIRENPTVNMVQTELELFSRHPEALVKPGDKLRILIGRYFSEMKGNVKKKKKYGKLKDAPLLIENLDIFKLIETFEDVRRLKNYLNKPSLPLSDG